MKKFLLYFFIFVLVFFILPIFCTSTVKEIISEQINEVKNSENILDDNVIKFLHVKTGEIEEIKINEYLYGVIAAEMPAKYEIEALKAQAVAARTYLEYHLQEGKRKHDNADICDSYEHCQAWISKEDRFSKWDENEREENWNKIVTAVNETEGQVITYNGELINAFFHSNSGGITESSVNIWGNVDYPYLKSVQTEGEENYEQYSSVVILSYEELLNKLKEKYDDIQIDFGNPESIAITEYTSSWRVKTIRFGNKEISGTEARSILGLKSTCFTVINEDERLTFEVTGNGHGVGMSQTGADALAREGKKYDEILRHFYTDVQVTKID